MSLYLHRRARQQKHTVSYRGFCSFSSHKSATRLCMERDRPLKLHLLWECKHVFLITIDHEPECRNTFVVQAGRGSSHYKNSFLPKKGIRVEWSPLSAFIRCLRGSSAQSPDAIHCAWKHTSHLVAGSTSYIIVWPIISHPRPQRLQSHHLLLSSFHFLSPTLIASFC